MSITVREALDRLASQPGPDAIAEFLRSEGIRGVRKSSECCVVASWLVWVTGEDVIDVSPAWPGDPDPGEVGTSGASEPLPTVVRDFTIRFDAGCYPELVESETT